jgi:BirA family transcriptional regulator, biotin operon repressor / biotin---[acetyl-CoA-carboxylase] ligase
VAVPFPGGVDPRRALIGALADGETRSAAVLERLLGRTEEELGAAAAELRELGIGVVEDGRGGRHGAPAEGRAGEKSAGGRPIEASGSQFRLEAPVELLDAGRIGAALDPGSREKLGDLALFFTIDSTNTWLLARPPPPRGAAQAALAELQLAGRGRLGRAWTTPFGGGIALSLAWTFRDAARIDPTLSLAAGVAVARALGRHGARGVALKWPNDLWFQDRKLGGILVELKSLAGGAGQVVIGVGLNLSLEDDTRRAIESAGVRVAALAEACEARPSRNALAAALLAALLSMLEAFERGGFAAFRDEWTSLDALAGRPVRILVGGETTLGVSRGVDTDGALMVESGGQLRRFVCGEASLRLHTGDL